MAGNVAPSLDHSDHYGACCVAGRHQPPARNEAMRDQRAEVSLNIAPDERYESAELEPRAFRILVVGDFSARGDAAATANDTPRRVDRDDLDAHLARIAPRLRIDVDGQPLGLAFTSMEDFLPDRL